MFSKYLYNKTISIFQTLEKEDNELKGLEEKLRKNQEEINQILYPLKKEKVYPLEKEIYERRKQLAVDSGLAVKRIEDMKAKSFRNNLNINFKLTKEDGMEVYRCGGSDEKYTFCNFCGLYLTELIEEQYDNIGPLSGSKGYNYSCPVCNNHIGSYAYMHS